MIQLHPYNLGSKSAMALKGYLTDKGIRVIVSHRLRSERKRMIVGWGAKSLDFPLGRNVLLNDPNITKLLSCKKRFFEHVRETGMAPCSTTDPEVARSWGSTVVCRATTTGSGGDGITIVDVGSDGAMELPHVPLYVKYEKKTHEYRLHVLGGEVREIQRKVFVKTDDNPEPKDWRIRNHALGFIFQTEAECPDPVREAVLKVNAVFGNGLSFAAFDVIYHKPTNKALVLEGNTAPGLEGPRLGIYGDYLTQKYKELM